MPAEQLEAVRELLLAAIEGESADAHTSQQTH